jgi:PAS domain-containing protein
MGTRSVDPEHLAARRAAMLAAVPIGLVLLDSRGEVVEMNPSAQRVLGLSHSARTLQALSKRLADPQTGAPLSAAELPWQRALAGGRVLDRDLLLAAPSPKTGRRLITISAWPFPDPAFAAAGALLLAFDRVEVLLRQTPTADLVPTVRRVLTLVPRRA